jgi:hypothetical protein
MQPPTDWAAKGLDEVTKFSPLTDHRHEETSMRFECIIAALVLASAATIATAADVPGGLGTSSGEALSLQTRATGVQIYACKAGKDDPLKYEWSLVAPEAELRDLNGKRIGKHYGGPTWEADDGSKVVGEVKARDNGPDANAIPWLLLTAKSNSGKGVFGGTTSVQRLDTTGGKAPAGSCEAKDLGREVRVPYTATYNFYGPR